MTRYGLERLTEVTWLHRSAVHYWGDLDTHGFWMLDRVRTRMPLARSFLMDPNIPTTSLGPYPEPNVGCRVVPASALGALSIRPPGYHPTFGDIPAIGKPFVGAHRTGWRLEHFVADLLLPCKEGHVASSETDHVLEQLFYPSIAGRGRSRQQSRFTVEAPEGVEFVLPELPSRSE